MKNINHVAFIMDGNRRWAREQKISVVLGHKKGYENMEPITRFAQEQGIKHLTFWAFSTENWGREKQELDTLMNLFRRLFKSKFLSELGKNDVRIVVLGEIDPFPADIVENIKRIVEDTKENKSMTINIGLNYGGREEILHAINNILKQGKIEITTEDVEQNLYTTGQPDPDIVVRTGGDQRLSGFLPWQSVYSELFFVKKYWPAFDKKDFAKIIKDFAKRNRRFGK